MCLNVNTPLGKSRCSRLVRTCCVVAAFGSIAIAVGLTDWMEIDASLWGRTVPITAPLFGTAVMVLLVTDWLAPTKWIGFEILGWFSMVFICASVFPIALAGSLFPILELHMYAEKALAVSFVLSIPASFLIVVHWCAAGALGLIQLLSRKRS